MRRTAPSTAWRLVLAVNVLCLVLLMSMSAPAQQEKAESGDKIKELKTQRLALLVKSQKMTAEMQSDGEATADQVHQTKQDVFAARLDLAETKDDRIKVCEETVKDAVEWKKFVEAKENAGQKTPVDTVNSEVQLLAARIALEKAKAAK